jgi:hypothetical protein
MITDMNHLHWIQTFGDRDMHIFKAQGLEVVKSQQNVVGVLTCRRE